MLKEPDLTGFGLLDEEEEETDEKSGDKPKKNKKIRRDLASLKKQKNDPNAPTATRMPLPDLRDSDKAEKAKALREMFRRQDLSTSLPSIIYYTVLNSCSSPSAIEICDDSRCVILINILIERIRIKNIILSLHKCYLGSNGKSFSSV